MTRLREVTIRPHDGSEPCTIELFVPELPGEPDVTVIGSANGGGKTTVLDAIAQAALVAGIPVAYRRERDVLAAQVTVLREGDGDILRPWAPSSLALEVDATVRLSAGLALYLGTMRLVRAAGVRGSLVLVDLPETFINAQMQRTWVHTATRLAPRSQLVIATHSEEITASVRPEARIMLCGDKGNP